MRRKKILFLRKKIEGQNSMEELAQSLKSKIPELEIVELPYYSTSLKGMFKNGIFARKHKAEVNHIFSVTEGYLSLFVSGIKIITVHDIYLKSLSILGQIVAYLFWLVIPSFFTNYYTCISKHTRSQFLNILPWVKKKTYVIYNPIKESFFKDYTPTKNPKTSILHIGTALHKNLSKVIEASKDLNCKLIIIGKLFPEQLELLKKYKIDYENSYDISTEQLLDLYHKSDIISFPSSQEGFGMIVVEANATRTPVIAGNIEVLREVGGEAAIFVNPNNSDEIKDAILCLITDPNFYQQMIERGLLNAQRFKLDNIAKEYSNLYKNKAD